MTVDYEEGRRLLKALGDAEARLAEWMITHAEALLNPWRPISEAPPLPPPDYDWDTEIKTDPVIVRAVKKDGTERIGEAYQSWVWTVDENMEDVARASWWWANDSCDCCYYEMSETPTHFRELKGPGQ